MELAAFAIDRGEPEGDGNGEGLGEIDGDGKGGIDGDGSAEGEGKGSPTRLTVRAASGLRCERSAEGMLGGATGADGGRLLT